MVLRIVLTLYIATMSSLSPKGQDFCLLRVASALNDDDDDEDDQIANVPSQMRVRRN